MPEEKIVARIPRLLNHIRQALPLCDAVYVLDNSRFDDPFRQVAVIINGELSVKQPFLPTWAKAVLADYLGE